MTWILLAGVPSLLYAIGNHIDKHLLEKHFKMQEGCTILLVISALVSVIALPFLYYWKPNSIFPDNLLHIPILVFMGLLYAALLWFYFRALNEEDTTTIVIFYSFLPILGLVMSGIFLGESLLPMQYVAMSVIILGIFIVAFEKDPETGFRLKTKAASLMFCASMCWALGDVTFKGLALVDDIWLVLFWEHLVLFTLGVCILLASKNLRNQIKFVLKENSTKIITINFVNEVLYIVANVVSAFPLLMVQVAAVHLVQAFQPVWVFLIALVLMYFGARENFTKEQLLQKSAATAIAVYGMYLLAISTPII